MLMLIVKVGDNLENRFTYMIHPLDAIPQFQISQRIDIAAMPQEYKGKGSL